MWTPIGGCTYYSSKESVMDSKYEIRMAQEDSKQLGREIIPELSTEPWPLHCPVCVGPCEEPTVLFPEDYFYGAPRWLYGDYR
jgi:hypothetical protein